MGLEIQGANILLILVDDSLKYEGGKHLTYFYGQIMDKSNQFLTSTD